MRTITLTVDARDDDHAQEILRAVVVAARKTAGWKVEGQQYRFVGGELSPKGKS